MRASDLVFLFEAPLAPVAQAKMGLVHDTAGLMLAVQMAGDEASVAIL